MTLEKELVIGAIVLSSLAGFVGFGIGVTYGRMTAPACPQVIERIIPDVQAPAHIEPSKVSGC